MGHVFEFFFVANSCFEITTSDRCESMLFVFVALTAVIHIVTVEYLRARESIYALLQ